MKLQTPKGFRDFLPEDALKRKFVLDKIVKVFARFGFDPLETPTLEYAETLKGKYGEEEKLIYQFKTAGGDEVTLKYDQTVPLARVIAQYGPTGRQQLLLPFKRYQIQPAYRGENTQKGRYREFLQCDADIIGVSFPLADAEILSMVYEIYRTLGLEVIIKINDRALLSNIEPKYLASLDKLNKIGQGGVLNELQDKGLPSDQAGKLFNRVTHLKLTEGLQQIVDLYKQSGYPQASLQFDPTLIRGLDYYTGLILEVVLKSDPASSSLCGGGRWDRMIAKFTGSSLPAIGFAMGFDRTIEAMEKAKLLDTPKTQTLVLVTVFSSELSSQSLRVGSNLRTNNIATEVWLDPASKLEKQLKYADQKGIPYVVIIGPDEVQSSSVTFRDLRSKTQERVATDCLIQKITASNIN